MADSWRPTMAYFRSATFGFGLVALALVFRRPDFLVLATPMVIVTAWSALSRPASRPTVADRLGRQTLREGEATSWHVAIDDALDVDVIAASAEDMDFVERRPAAGSVTGAVSGDRASLSLTVRSMRWGRRNLDPLKVSAASVWGAFESSAELHPQSLTTLPLVGTFDAAAPMRPSRGLVGAHRSRRPGDGSEFATVRDFQTGDRMRRINWSRSQRSDHLLVNATWADQDVHVALVVDVGEDLGISGGIEGRASSLDTTVRAAGAIAQHYSQRGNRVSLRGFDPSVRISVPPGAGQAHLRRLLDTLARANAPAGRFARAGARATNTADVTVVLSPLASPAALDRAVTLGRRGGSVAVIDTLPDHVIDDDDPLLALAWRIRLLERRRELRRAAEVGVVVTRWQGPGSLDHFLRSVARQAAAPRVRQ